MHHQQLLLKKRQTNFVMFNLILIRFFYYTNPLYKSCGFGCFGRIRIPGTKGRIRIQIIATWIRNPAL